MQTRRNHQVRFSGLWPGKVLEMANSLQSDAEGLSGGAGNGCYGKSGGFDVPAVVYRRE